MDRKSFSGFILFGVHSFFGSLFLKCSVGWIVEAVRAFPLLLCPMAVISSVISQLHNASLY
jgi:hypothetical protein